MAERVIGDRVVRLIRGDITELDVEAFVFDIESDVKLGAGFGSAIQRRGGIVIQKELDQIGNCPTGEAVVTQAGILKAEYIIHVNGPKFREADEEDKLRNATKNALRRADEKGIKRLAIPPIGTGLYQVPMDLCVRVMLDTVAEHLENNTTLEEVLIVTMDEREYKPFKQAIERGSLTMPDHEPSSLLFAAEVIHWVALGVMAIVYTLRLRWLFSFKAGKDRSAPGQPDKVSAKEGGVYSLGNVAMPWAMETTRSGKGLLFWFSFVIFHLGVVAGIALAFVSTVAPEFLRIPAVAWIIGGTIFGAFLVAVYRLFRRLLRPVLRLISSPDDYFSLIMLTVWFALGVVTQAHIAGMERFASENWLVAYLLLTSFFLIYVPFSKISHYLYYPFSRWWIGKALGHRGSYPYSRA